MKWINQLFCLICLFLLQSAYAAVPVTLSGPTPPIASSYAVGSSTIVIFTITNNVPRALPLTICPLAAPLSRVTVANDCGSFIPAGPSTCNIGILIAPTAANAGTTVNQNLIIEFGGRTPLVSNIAFTVPGRLSTAVLTAVGFTGGNLLLAVSTNGGDNWAVNSFTGSGFFTQTSCTGTGSSIICTAVGQLGSAPLVAQSFNGGVTWAAQTVAGSPPQGQLSDTSCTGSTPDTTVCIAGGQNAATTAPLIVISQDLGVWNTLGGIGLPASGVIHGTSCTGEGDAAICVAAGRDFVTAQALLVQTVDGADTFQIVFIPGTPASSRFNTASCAGTICVAAGEDFTGAQPPLLAQTTNSGATWSYVLPSLVPTGRFNGSACADSNICVAVGQIGDVMTGVPLLAATTNGGASWNVEPIIGLPPGSGQLARADCTGTGATAICTAVGQIGSEPLLVISTDGGATWTRVPNATIAGLPAVGILLDTSCTGTGATAICTAVGGNDITGLGAPFTIQSINGGLTWAVVPISGLPGTGVFTGAAAAGG